MINSEADVRTWVRDASGGKARWVEPALGSTPGLPDCWVPWPTGFDAGEVVHLELKCGVLKDGVITYKVRPEQKREIPAIMKDGVKVGLLVGIKGTGVVVFAYPNSDALNGRLSFVDGRWTALGIDSTAPGGIGFWRGVNFIFSDLGF